MDVAVPNDVFDRAGDSPVHLGERLMYSGGQGTPLRFYGYEGQAGRPTRIDADNGMKEQGCPLITLDFLLHVLFPGLTELLYCLA